MWNFPNGLTALLRSPADAGSSCKPGHASSGDLTSWVDELDKALAEDMQLLTSLEARVKALGRHPLRATQSIKAGALRRLIDQIEDCAERARKAVRQSREDAGGRLAERQRQQRELTRGLEALEQELAELDRRGYH